MRGATPAAVAMCVLLSWTTAAEAQAPQTPPARPRGPARLEVSGGGGIDTAVALGDRQAALRGSGAPGTLYSLFNTSTQLAAGPRAEVRVGYALTPRYTVEGQLSFARPEVRATISGDVEGAEGLTAAGHVDQYSVTAGLTVRLPVSFAGTTPFVSGGAGYVRELRENLPPIEEGYLVYAGGGVRRPLVTRPNGLLRTVGVRADVRWQMVEGVVAVVDRPRSQAAISGSLFMTF